MTRTEAEQWLAGVGEPECGMLAVPAKGSDMIERKCETCEYLVTGRCPDLIAGCWPCTPDDLRDWRPSRAALEAEVDRLGDKLNAYRTALRESNRRRKALKTGKIVHLRAMLDAAYARERAALAQVAARDEEIATLRARVDDSPGPSGVLFRVKYRGS